MAEFNWLLPEVTLDGVKYSIVYLPMGKIRLCITGSGRVPSADEVRPWISNQHRIDDIRIGEGITEIGDRAFFGCRKLQRVWFPDTLQSVGANAFAGCPLEEVFYEHSNTEDFPQIAYSNGSLPQWAQLAAKEGAGAD